VQKEFKLINIGNYPNPVSSNVIDPNNAGRTRFTYTLTADADEVKIEIYTVSGRLVNSLNNLPSTVGYHEYPRTQKGWECVDKDGRRLANGVYFYKIIATKGKQKIEKIEKLAILR
jgi:flagellar hook assembly protein FlgD